MDVPKPDWSFVDVDLASAAEPLSSGSLESRLVRHLAGVCSPLVDLAAAASLAIQVEPFLLRRLRLHFLPQSDASLEADLAFSELVTSHTSPLEIDPAFFPALRAHLLRKGWVEQAREIIAASHAELSVALQIEEEVIFLTAWRPAGWNDRVTALLARAAKAAESRPEVARWAYRAIQDLPAGARSTDGFWLLADKTGHATGRELPLGPMPAASFRKLANILSAASSRQIDVGAARDQSDLLLTIPPTQADFVFSAPETIPVPLIITAGEKTHQLKLAMDSGAAFARVSDFGAGPITVRTLGDTSFVIPAAMPAPPAEPIFENSRDRHLFGAGPKWILSLDGGGIRTVVTLAFLERIETLLQEHQGRDVRLGDYFDLIGGTSTGAILAGALALGYRTAQLKDIFLRLAPFAYKRSRWRVPLLQAKFDARGLRSQIEDVVGDRLLSSTDLITGLCVIAKRMDIGEPWIVVNNPRSPHWSATHSTSQKSEPINFIGTSQVPLVSLIRASTAAPHFFDPEPIALTPGGPSVHMIDGGVTPHNNPALALFQIVTAKAQGLLWRTGPENLGMISIGTGTYRPRLAYQSLGFARFTKLAFHSLLSIMNDLEMAVLGRMQYMGECPNPWSINSEIGTLARDEPPGGKMFRFLRYDVRLEKDWLARELNYNVSDERLAGLRGMDDPGMVHELYTIGAIAAKKQVKSEHFVGRPTSVGAASIGDRS